MTTTTPTAAAAAAAAAKEEDERHVISCWDGLWGDDDMAREREKTGLPASRIKSQTPKPGHLWEKGVCVSFC